MTTIPSKIVTRKAIRLTADFAKQTQRNKAKKTSQKVLKSLESNETGSKTDLDESGEKIKSPSSAKQTQWQLKDILQAKSLGGHFHEFLNSCREPRFRAYVRMAFIHTEIQVSPTNDKFLVQDGRSKSVFDNSSLQNSTGSAAAVIVSSDKRYRTSTFFST
jgi:hypothetical protein